MQSPDMQRLKHIIEYCDAIAQTIQRYGATFECYLEDPDYQRSISFSILQIGELSAALSEEFRRQTQYAMPWREIKNMRSIVAHSYGHVDHKIVWNTANNDIPELRAFCEAQIAQ